MNTPEELMQKFKDLPALIIQRDNPMLTDPFAHPKWKIPDKVVVTAALVGAFFTRNQNPHHIYSPEEIIREAEECMAAGASSIHIHVREPNGSSSSDTEKYRQAILPLKKKYGDSIVIDGCAQFGKNFEDSVRPMTEELFEVAPVNPVCTFIGDNPRWVPRKTVEAQGIYFQAKGAKVQVSVHDTASIDNAKRFLIDTGILRKPYYFIILPALPGFAYMPNEMAMTEIMLFLVRRLRELDPDVQIMVCCAGRPSMYLTALSMILGLHVRVGMEDTIWKLPHKDDLITSNAECVRTAVQLAKLLGRDVATADDYRRIMGFKKELAGAKV